MNEEPVRLGFIGAGRHARLMLYPSLHFAPSVRLTAIATRTAESAARAEADFRVRCYTGHEGLLADDSVEAVVIAVPGKAAAELSAAALLAGKHVLCETPAITSPEDAERVGEACARSGKAYQVGYLLRCSPIYHKLKGLLDAWRQEGEGSFCLDIRYFEWIHHFYNLALYLGGDVARVHAWGQGRSRRVVLEFANGDLGTIRATAFQNHAIPYEEVEVTRADGMLRATDRLELHCYREPEAVLPWDMEFDTASATLWRGSTSVGYNRLSSLYASGCVAEIEHFAECIRTGKAPLSTLADAAQTAALRRAVDASLKEQATVPV
ncbi:MAG: Gfo/Idh/MocA family oxidoreductase [Armatimonadetes bacterium]|nr:Gfo/Idh/MocA family oxidoreductase [Armatimonadota bacterium]